MMVLLRILSLQCLLLATFARAADDTHIISEVTERFRPSKPTLIMNYDVTYALMNIRLKRVANATLKATEGVWLSRCSNEWISACLIDFDVASPRTGDEDVCLFKRTVSVLTLPDLKIITYAKHNDEFIKPLFQKGRHMKYVELYNFESATPTYRHHDLYTGLVETNLPGIADLAKQSNEVADVLHALFAAYHDKHRSSQSLENKIHFNVDGAVRTFTLDMKKGRTPSPVSPGKLSALYADIQPGKNSESRNESFSMWCVPFRELSRTTTDSDLMRLAETSLECSMLPLSGEYGLFLGAIQCNLINIFVQPQK